MARTIVIGGGIVGASTAFHLSQAGEETLLFDRRDAGRATDAGAGIISPETSRHSQEAFYTLGIQAAKYYPQLVAAVKDEGVTETGYDQPGALVIDPSFTSNDGYSAGETMIFDRQAASGHPSTDELYKVSGQEAQELFPALGDVNRGVYYSEGARVDGRIFQDALLDAGSSLGLTIKEENVQSLLIDAGEVRGVKTTADEYAATNVVISGGAWSPSFSEELDQPLPIEPQRGQIIHLALSDAATSEWPIVNTMEEGFYLVPWDDARVAAGATREAGSGFAPQTTAEGVHEVLDFILQMAPGIAEGAIDDIRVGLRPVCKDGLPVLGESPSVDGAYFATGHGPSGLTLGPYSGKCVADQIMSNTVEIDMAPYAPSRF